MDNYQLRLPADFGVMGLADRLAEALQGQFKRLGLAWREDNPLSLVQAIRATLERHLVTYDTCGSSSLCDQCVSAVAWNSRGEEGAGPDEVLRVHFRLSAEEFYSFTALFARVAASQSDVSEGRALYAQEELEKAVFIVLSDYLFEAPLCRNRELCKGAIPADIWGGVNPWEGFKPPRQQGSRP